MAETPSERRTVYLPLEKLNKCAVCKNKKNLRLCSSCGERIYCSAECQKNDWSSHKLTCGKTDRIDLSSFYPLLACLVEQSHTHQEKPFHPALQHRILNSPNPNVSPYDLPDGSAAKLLLLGEQLPPQQAGSESWWPSAITPKVRSKLMRRIVREGHVLPIAMSVCLALLAEMYTTTFEPTGSGGKEKRRVRLRYHSSPIADFGIATGSADVKNQDRLAYFNPSGAALIKGQDPNNHFWIYFTTIRGEDVLLDCAMFTFNMCLMVPTQPYAPGHLAALTPFAPAYFRDRAFDRSTPDLHKERKRVSILRNRSLHSAVAGASKGFSESGFQAIWSTMESISGRKCSQKEKQLVRIYAPANMNILAPTLEQRKWQNFPNAPSVAIEADPGEMEDMEDLPNDEWMEYMTRMRRLQKKGLATNEEVGKAHRAYTANYSRARRNL